MTDDDSLLRAIVGALRAAIHDHGPIGPQQVGSAAKRILGNLVNARPGGLERAFGRRRWDGVSAEERANYLGGLARARWASMTPEERSAEMRRRATKRQPTKRP